MLTKKYSFPAKGEKKENYLYFDIETTGFQKDRTILYLIGCGFYKDSQFHVIQWFNDDAVSEKALLLAFKEQLEQNFYTLFSFNGESFDLPYLAYHYQLNDIPSPLKEYPSFDLYKTLRPFQSLFSLAHGRQKDWEHFLGWQREDLYDGGALISVYKEYLKKREPALLDSLLLHNREDIYGMESLHCLTVYPRLLTDALSPAGISLSEKRYAKGNGSLLLECPLPFSLPKELVVSSPIGSIRGEHKQLLLTLPLWETTLKHFFSDYKNYYYLPEEDRAIHKSVGCYVDVAHRQKAKRANCYQKKKSVYLPFPSAKKQYGLQINSQEYKNALTLYQMKDTDRTLYAEFDEIFCASFWGLSSFLRDCMNEICIVSIQEKNRKPSCPNENQLAN